MTGRSPWQTHEIETKAQYIQENQPEFLTILECNARWSKGEAPPAELAYRGPFYLDWDGESIEDVLGDVRSFIGRLESMEFDLRQASWWLSGRKGVHCTIPMACLLNTKAYNTAMISGIQDLPDIYRNLAWELITPHLDMRVYTAKRGRMWRTCYRSRTLDNGTVSWKVPITPEQLKTLDTDGYWEWCSKQRPEIQPEKPTPNSQLMTLFTVVSSSLKSQKRERNKNKKIKKVKFESLESTPTIQALFNGEAVLESCNLNDIKLQMATAAVAVGMSSLDDEDQYIEAIAGFIEKRSQLKGTKHSSKTEIEQAMREAFRYVAENSYFVYSPKGLRSILNDTYSGNIDYFGVDTKSKEQREQFIKDIAGDMQASEIGVIQITPNSTKPIANYIWKPGSLQVIRDDNNRVTYYSVIPIVSGRELDRLVLSLQEINNEKKFNVHIQMYGGSVATLNAKESGQFRQALLNFVGDSVEHAPELKSTCLEGVYVDTVETTGTEDAKPEELLSRFWVEATETYEGTLSKRFYCNQPFYVNAANPTGIFKTDLFNSANQVKCHDKEMVTAIQHLLDLNGNTYSLSVLLGWFSACYIKQTLYKMDLIKNFPLMQIVGQAGSGKTTTINLLLNLFSFKNKLNVLAANNTSRFAIEKRLVSSASIPVVVDEVKAQNVSNQWMQDFRGLLQVAYTLGSTVSKGGGNSAGSHYAELSNQPMLAPIAWLGESIDTSQTSLLERLVPAMFHLDDKVGRAEHVKFLSRNESYISALGYLLAKHAITVDLTVLKNLFLKDESEVTKILYNGANDRIVSNAVAVTVGFDFFVLTLQQYFGQVFDQKLSAMRNALLNKSFWTTEVASEVVMFLKNMSNASRESDISLGKPIIGQHYRFIEGEGATGREKFLLVSAPRLFMAYRTRCKISGVAAVYTSDVELFSVLKNSSFAVDSFDDNFLSTDCIKLDIGRLEEAGVPNFSTK